MTFNLADLFEIVADTIPDREALICGDGRLTYRELDERTNRLAHHMLAAGIGRNVAAAGPECRLTMFWTNAQARTSTSWR